MTEPVEDFELSDDNSLKIIVVGDASVGKTCMLISYSNNEFPTEYNPTVFDNYTANVVYKEKTVTLGLWDTAGTDEYDQLRPLSYPDTHIFVIVFDVTNKDSLESVTKKWVPEIKEHTKDRPGGVPFLIVGNKLDLRNDPKEKDRCVPRSEAEKVKQKTGAARLLECSAKTQEGLKDVFEQCIEVVIENYMKKKKGGKKNEKCTLQ
ncbi:hypothetical protein C9374_006080 [Naegleria lovaniensis]|uniref:Rho family small GTPase n=1 Tax=Naegleria lovaniensis TaxID=51637 RepID=A0AA88KMP8_NAELO|nr:uncharacterized protein C9374_006080 [Naegleria lovaniensis]KAG2381696.1 hypothetical protein C9374_006080 [Naegleria lovaniensis]